MGERVVSRARHRGPARRRAGGALGATLLLAAGVVVGAPVLAAATPPYPTSATAVVDGVTAEWSSSDVWGSLASNDPPHRIVGTVSLRYDCEAGVLHVLVRAAAGETLQTADAAEAYVRLGPSGKLVSGDSGLDGTAPDFAWVGAADGTADGFEASAVVAPGEHPAALRVHAKLPDDSGDGYETVDLMPRYSDLAIACPTEVVPTTVVATTAVPTTVGDPSTPPPPTVPRARAVPVVAAAGADPIEPAPGDPGDPPTTAPTELPRTGSGTGELTVLGTGLLAVGAVLVRRTHRTAG